MDRNIIKKILRESLLDIVSETEGEAPLKRKKNIKKDYADIQNALNKDNNPTAPSQVGVMIDSLGWPDDEGGTNRSLFGKMLHQERNEEGSIYQFNDQQLAKVRTALKLN